MSYLGKITKLPADKTGQMEVIVPSLSGESPRVVRPKAQYMGLIQPYILGDVVQVEEIEGTLYYSDRIYSNVEYTSPIPMDRQPYGFTCPHGYIIFTPDGLEIVHKKGGKLILSDKLQTVATTTTNSTTVTPISSEITKWR